MTDERRFPPIKDGFVDTYAYFQKDRSALHETNDCTVISFATVWGCSYADAHKHLKMFADRKHRRGMSADVFDEADTWCKRTKMRKGPYDQKNKISLAEFCRRHPVGRYWIRIHGHALAVIDGVVYDHSYSPRRQVACAFRVYGPKEK